MFIKCNKKIINSDMIDWIDTKNIVELGYIRIHYKDELAENVEGAEAVDIVMRLCPHALEGRQLKYIRNRWAIHNLIGHPLMQIFSWLHLASLGIRIHDATIPYPRKEKWNPLFPSLGNYYEDIN